MNSGSPNTRLEQTWILKMCFQLSGKVVEKWRKKRGSDFSETTVTFDEIRVQLKEKPYIHMATFPEIDEVRRNQSKFKAMLVVFFCS